MRRSWSFALVLLALGATALNVEAQTQLPELTLTISRVNGFGLGGRIQGRFRLTAAGPADMQRVTFLIDGAPIGEVAALPFRINFDTGSYELGRHDLSAVGISATGKRLEGSPLTVEFVSPETARNATLGIIVPVLAIALAVSAVVGLSPLLGGGARRRGHIGGYGLAGGAICPRCGLPFSRHLFTPNLFGSRLERCPHCAKWSLAGRATPEQLGLAEARQHGQQVQAPASSEDEDSVRRTIDDSRFDG